MSGGVFIPQVRIEVGDALALLRREPDASVHCCVTSPPYWRLRDYGVTGQTGMEETPEAWASGLAEVFGEVRRVLRPDGTLWVNVGDGYACGGNGSRDPKRWPKQQRNDHRIQHAKRLSRRSAKDLVGMPWLLAFALQRAGWTLRCDIIWSKPSPMPESVTDRPTRSHEYIFLFSRSSRYWYDADAIREPYAAQNRQPGRERGRENRLIEPNPRGRNARSVWTIPSSPFPGAHFATFPEELARRCILAGCPEQVCARCGAPRQRMTRTEYANPGNRTTNGPRSVANREITAGYAQRLEAKHETVGWSDCGCDAGWSAGTVLDPYAGSGTTGAVAARYGRHALLLELNPEYAEMARRRTYPDAQPRLDLAAVAGDVE